jgi:hypothetical protein
MFTIEELLDKTMKFAQDLQSGKMPEQLDISNFGLTVVLLKLKVDSLLECSEDHAKAMKKESKDPTGEEVYNHYNR